MIKKIIAIMVVMVVLIGVSGCASSEKIKTEEQASEAVIGASESIQDISSTLNDVDKALG